MFGFSEIRYSYVTFKVKIPNRYLCPFIKMLFKVAHLIKTCCKKKIIMAVGKGLTKKLKSVFESKNIRLKNKTSEAFMFFQKNKC